jgi:ATP-dependent Lhr-like helicase
MESGGAVRRGYFVEGLSGAQFGSPAAIERLRQARMEEAPIDGFGADAVRILSAVDPANPYGSLLAWPATGGGNPPKRVQGAHLVLVAGKPQLYLGPAARHLLTFPSSRSDEGGELALAFAALHRIPRVGRRRLSIQLVDDAPAFRSPLCEQILAAGFQLDGDALVPILF